MTDYYQTLGVGRDASDEDIKKAYRSMAMKHHPDRGGDAAMFQRVQEAYENLSDPNKRAQHDAPQQTHHHQGWHQQAGGFHFNFGGMDPGFESFIRTFGPDVSNMFGFRQPVNRPVHLQTTITLEEAFHGKEMTAVCTMPSGREQTININIPPGVHEGSNLKFVGIGEDAFPGAPRGDIILTIHIQNHPTFRRQGDDLLIDKEISCVAAMLGSTISIETIDGRILETTIPSGVQHDTLLNLNGYGMPNMNDPSRRGRLLLKLKVAVPKLSEEQKYLLRQLNL